DVSTNVELISASKSPSQISEHIVSDSLAYLTVAGLIDFIGLAVDAPYKVLCVESFIGDYPAGLYDYEQDYFEHLSERQKEYLANHKQYFDREGNLNV